VAGLLEQAVAAGLGLAKLTGGVGVRLRQELAGLGLRRVDDLGALALGLGPVALDLGLALLQLELLRAHFLLGPLHLRRGRGLRVALERIGELRRRSDQMKRVHADRMTGGLDVGGLARRLQHAQLRLQLGGVAAERVERLADAGLVVAVARALELLQARKRGQSRGRTL
jgi:hypothetical protein